MRDGQIKVTGIMMDDTTLEFYILKNINSLKKSYKWPDVHALYIFCEEHKKSFNIRMSHWGKTIYNKHVKNATQVDQALNDIVDVVSKLEKNKPRAYGNHRRS